DAETARAIGGGVAIWPTRGVSLGALSWRPGWVIFASEPGLPTLIKRWTWRSSITSLTRARQPSAIFIRPMSKQFGADVNRYQNPILDREYYIYCHTVHHQYTSPIIEAKL